MAITRLTDIITVFDSKWTYGDVKFGYDGEVNQDHDTQYPLMLVNPPESIMPVVYDGREEYSFEINFYNLYSQAAQSVVTLQKRWDNLQDLSNEWLDMVLKNYQDVTVEAYLNDESIEIERIKDTKNDKLVQIKLVFTMSAFTKCFRPVSNYPSDFADLVVWLRADSGVTFDIPTKRVSAWADKSGQGTDVAQTTVKNQPLRYGYGGINDKAYIGFDGTNDSFVSSNNLPITTDFTIFEVSKIQNQNGSVFYYQNGNAIINLGTDGGGQLSVIVADEDSDVMTTRTGIDSRGEAHIAVLLKHNKRIDLQYYDSSNSVSFTSNNSSFSNSQTFNQNTFKSGYNLINTTNLGGELNELIIFNRSLSNTEINNITGYLNLKYKIY